MNQKTVSARGGTDKKGRKGKMKRYSEKRRKETEDVETAQRVSADGYWPGDLGIL